MFLADMIDDLVKLQMNRREIRFTEYIQRMMRTISLFLLFLTIDGGFGCSCFPSHSQTAFCGSEVVIRGKAISRNSSPQKDHLKNPLINNGAFPKLLRMYGDVVYEIEVIEIFKLPSETDIKVGDTVQAVTGANGAMCGGYLALNTDILITGRQNGKSKLKFGLCNFQAAFSSLTNVQLEGIRGLYDCRCQIYPWQTDATKKIDTCYVDEFPGYDTTCLEQYGRCSQEESGECKWNVEQNNSCLNPRRN
ncbi:metalloproteinase inhibitor 2-like [Mytilus californianus]|uniref:metalloproteinase inhibitor 2-like n=1 Tax=Mytilus californianus TaxID=6549 RepID=UPI0022465C89|nr:metalloproteinase inhibitor 2-like [Mytilus californianus]